MRTNLTEKTMRVAEGRANKILVFCVAVMVAILLELLLVVNPAYASTFTVNSTADPGTGGCDVTECTLREAIEAANANNNTTTDTINFNIPEAGPHTIASTSTLEITAPVVINGYSQPGSKANALTTGNNAELKIELSGPGQGTDGLKIEADNSTVKGLVINNWGNGIFLGTEATDNTVQGNFIGTDVTGTVANPDGIPDSGDDGNNIGVVVKDTNSTIGGTNPAARNIISGNSGFGVNISGGTETKVQGNYIGTKKDGISALGNNYGVVIESAPENTIGGTTAAARNIISHNTLHGIFIRFPGATDNTVQGNIINGNGGSGVEVLFEPTFGPEPPTGNRILSNSIYDNDFLGIDLVHPNDPAGVTLNDDGDGDGGIPPDPAAAPNRLQNYPEITSVEPITKRIKGKKRRFTVIRGILNSTLGETFTIQFFSSPEDPTNPGKNDPSGYGEGKTFAGQLTKVTTDNTNGDASFAIRVARRKAPVGSVITATATNNSTGDTSEFSKACKVPAEPCAP